jgi:hypothetical protein
MHPICLHKHRNRNHHVKRIESELSTRPVSMCRSHTLLTKSQQALVGVGAMHSIHNVTGVGSPQEKATAALCMLHCGLAHLHGLHSGIGSAFVPPVL